VQVDKAPPLSVAHTHFNYELESPRLFIRMMGLAAAVRVVAVVAVVTWRLLQWLSTINGGRGGRARAQGGL
jgi:hypothetical protein